MSTWGTGPFDNDAARAWLRDLGRKKTPAARAKFVLGTPCHSTEPSEIERGVASCEAISWLAGSGKYDTPLGLCSELSRSGVAASPLELDRSLRFIELARSRANLMGWTEPRREKQWLGMLSDLSRRLGGGKKQGSSEAKKRGRSRAVKKTAKKTAKKASGR